MFLIFSILGYLIAAILALSMFLVPWLMMRQPKSLPAVVSPDSIRRHLGLVFLIRGVEFLICASFLLFLSLIALGLFLVNNPFNRPPAFTPFFSIPLLILMLLLSAYFFSRLISNFSDIRQKFFREIGRVNANSVGTFAFIFAYFVAHDAYHFLPSNLVAGHKVMPTIPFFDRDILWIPIFWGVWYLSKALLLRLLELNRPEPPSDPKPPGSLGSLGPFLPFDPCDLSKNRPIHPLPEN
jgi:hypothetical protein